MEFRTEWHPSAAESPQFIEHSDGIFCIGSCFADNVASRLSEDLFNVSANPFGPMFNPVSICRTLERLIEGNAFTADELFEHQGLWRSLDAGTLYARGSREETCHLLNGILEHASQSLHEAKVLIITLGTAWVFTHRGSARVVANCHKLPATDFVRSRLDVGEVADAISPIAETLYAAGLFPRIVLTVSPVRHAADGLHGNNLSKSTLLLATDEVVERYPEIHYFPSYELIMDDLRDYRFYDADMRHPSQQAVDYVYSRFCETCLTGAARTAAAECRQLSRRLRHTINPNTPDDIAGKFRADTDDLLSRLLVKYPYINTNNISKS